MNKKLFILLIPIFILGVWFLIGKNIEKVNVFAQSPLSWGSWQHGGELNQFVLAPTSIDGATGNVVRLGDPSYTCSGVPVGSAWMKKNIDPTRISQLNFRYRIFSQDRDTTLSGNFDTFDVYINNQLVIRDDNTTANYGCNTTIVDLGWKNGTVNLSTYSVPVELKFAVRSYPDSWYNTYVYLDGIIDGTNACLLDPTLPQCLVSPSPSSCADCRLGDLNQDCSINAFDMVTMIKNWKP